MIHMSVQRSNEHIGRKSVGGAARQNVLTAVEVHS
jgi:hypothetical protein